MKKFLYSLLLFFTFLLNAQSVSSTVFSRAVEDSNIVLPPAWAFGVLYGGYTNQSETIDRITEIQKHDYPIDAYWIDSWFWSYTDNGLGPKKYIDFAADTLSFPNRIKMWQFMQTSTIKGGFWIWDCILQTGNEKVFDEFKQKGFFSSIFNNTNTWHNSFGGTDMYRDNNQWQGTPCGNINFDDPNAAVFFKQKVKHFFDEGADFIKLDRTSPISVCKTMFEITQEFGRETKGRGFILSHTGGMETDEYKNYPAKWTDDTRSDWTVEKPLVNFDPWVPSIAFKENIAMYTDPKQQTSQIPFLTNDLGGFDVGKADKPDEELYIRWLQFSMFCPITEVFSQPQNATSNLAWRYSERADTIFRFYSHLRLQLFPYIYSCAQLNRITGKPMIGKIPEHLYQFMFGDELLLAPVYEKGAVRQNVFLPEGKWVNYWTNETLEGQTEYLVASPIDKIPIFVKQGSIIPMRQYASSVEKGSNNTLLLHIYPGSDGYFNLIEDDGTSNDYLKGIFASTELELQNSHQMLILKIFPLQGKYNGIKKTREWRLLIHSTQKPKQIKLNNQKINFEFDKVNKITTADAKVHPVSQLLKFEIYYK